MPVIEALQSWLHNLSLPALFVVGLMTALGFYLGKSMKFIRLPSIIGFMVIGVLLGPSLIDLVNENLKENLSFITEIALGFVAVSIGLELSLAAIKRQGRSMIAIILSESLLTFIVVTLGIFLLTRDLPLALLFGAVAPASAPAGTVAVIQEYRARGSLTQALYTVVGFDDGLGIIIFGFASAVAQSLLVGESGEQTASFLALIARPFCEVGLSLIVGAILSLLYCLLARGLKSGRDLFIITFATVLVSTGLSLYLHLSFILTNLVLGMVVANTQPHGVVERIRHELTEVMPLFFVMFFVLAGANLHLATLPALGLIGCVYVLGRSAGLMGGAWLGAVLGKAEKKIRKYLGLGILSQAGVAIGLALIVKHEFAAFGERGARIGAIVLTSITATCILFELIGPICTKIGLSKAGEIGRDRD